MDIRKYISITESLMQNSVFGPKVRCFNFEQKIELKFTQNGGTDHHHHNTHDDQLLLLLTQVSPFVFSNTSGEFTRELTTY
jgi:hypothetical protein